MECPEYEALMGEYALGNDAQLTPEEGERAVAHLKECLSCRETLEAEKRLFASLRRAHGAIGRVDVSSETVERVTQSVRAAVRRRKRMGLVLRIAGACAGLAAAVLAICFLLPDGQGPAPGVTGIETAAVTVETNEPTRTPQSDAADVPREAHEAVRTLAVAVETNEPTRTPQSNAADVPREAHEAIRALRARLAGLETWGWPFSICEEVINSATALAAKYPETEIALRAKYLVYQANCRVAETRRAQEVFAEYLETAEKVRGREWAARAANGEGNRRFRGEGLLESLFYYGMAAKRYPDLEGGQYAMFRIGKCYERIDEPLAAIAQYEKLAADHPGTKWARRGYRALPTLHFNLQDRETAIQVYEKFMEEFPDEETVAECHFQIAMMEYAGGELRYPKALEHFKVVMTRYPQHRRAKSATGMMELMMNEVMGEILEE